MLKKCKTGSFADVLHKSKIFYEMLGVPEKVGTMQYI